MDEETTLNQLLELAESMEIDVRSAPPASDFGSESPGGAVVTLKGRRVVFLRAAAAPAEQIGVLAAALRGLDALEDIYLPPRLRELLWQDGG